MLLGRINIAGLVILLIGAVINFASAKLARQWGKPAKEKERKTAFQIAGLVLAVIGALMIFEIL